MKIGSMCSKFCINQQHPRIPQCWRALMYTIRVFMITPLISTMLHRAILIPLNKDFSNITIGIFIQVKLRMREATLPAGV